MQQRRKLPWISTSLAVLCTAGGIAVPAAGDVFAWRTEDGTYAFADDAEHVPARYAAQAQRIERGALDGYARYTAQDATATRSHEERLAARLEHLRKVNAQPAVATATAVARSGAPGVLSIPTGDEDAPRLELPLESAASESGPVIVEPVIAKRTGESRTRRATVVRRGDEVLAVVKGVRHVFDPSIDIHDEDALEDGSEISR